MEAIESLGIDWKLLIAQIVNFVILLLILWKFLYNPILNMLDKRKGNIKQGIEDADQARQKLEQAQDETRKLIAEATLESEKIVKSAKKEMEAETKQTLSSAQKKAEEIIESSRRLAADEQKKIVEKARKEISDLAVTISEKILQEQLDKSSVNKAIEQI